MARFYFDIDDTDGSFADVEGMELPSTAAALAEARIALGEMVRDMSSPPVGATNLATLTVLDEGRSVIARFVLQLHR